MRSVLFVFAHQDDEVGIATRIAYEARAGSGVWCVYLTDGASAVPAAVRDAESRAVLVRAGVAAERIVPLTDARGRIPDGRAFLELERARAMLAAWIAATGVRFDAVFTLDWEGGHADHDAVHVATVAACRDAGLPLPRVFSLYNAYRRPKKLFRVASFVPSGCATERRAVTLREALAAALLPFAYPSQRRTWSVLGPGFAARWLLRRAELTRLADVGRLAGRPHDGPLLYETLFGVASDDVLEATAALRARLTAPAWP